MTDSEPIIDDGMRTFTIVDSNHREETVTLDNMLPISALKTIFSVLSGIPEPQIVFIHNGSKLRDESTIKDNNINNNDKIFVVLRLAGR